MKYFQRDNTSKCLRTAFLQEFQRKESEIKSNQAQKILNVEFELGEGTRLNTHRKKKYKTVQIYTHICFIGIEKAFDRT